MTSSFTLESLYELISERAEAPADERSYTQQNLKRGVERLAQKLGEEATETLIAALGCKNAVASEEAKKALCEESADLLYHLCLLWYTCGTTPQEVCAVLEERSRNKKTHHP